MKTVETIKQLVSKNRDAWFEYRKKLESNLQTLDRLYAKRYADDTVTPKTTIREYVTEVGMEDAIEVVASLVNRYAWDGRISKYVATWAAAQENAWDEKAAVQLYIGLNSIHCCHLNQLAEELIMQ